MLGVVVVGGCSLTWLRRGKLSLSPPDPIWGWTWGSWGMGPG